MEFSILGPLEAWHDGRPVPLGSQKQRALLAILLLRANEAISTDALIDELWGERPPPSASHTLHAYVSRLRASLREIGADGGVLVTRPGGYLLRLEFGELDLHRFEQLAEDARRALASDEFARAAAKLGEALALWRGPPLADLAFEPFARIDVERLEEQRLAALEDRIEAELALGNHAALVPEVGGLVAAHPLRERFRAQLMLALYRSGRQADALDAYRDARTFLVGGLGIEPSGTLRALEQAMLRHDQTLELERAPGGRVAVLATVDQESGRTATAEDVNRYVPARADADGGAGPARDPRRIPTRRRRTALAVAVAAGIGQMSFTRCPGLS